MVFCIAQYNAYYLKAFSRFITREMDFFAIDYSYFCCLQYFPLASFARSYRITDEAFIAETKVWPIFCLSYEYFLSSKMTLTFVFLSVRRSSSSSRCLGNAAFLL